MNDLAELNFSNINLARKTLTENFFAAKHEANEFWEFDFGAKALKYCGRYVTDNMSKLYDANCYYTDVVTYVRESCGFLF